MDTWENRDLPVLAAIVAMTEEGETHPEPAAIAQRTGLDDVAVDRALWSLAAESPPFFQYLDGSTFAGRSMIAVHDPTGHARRTVGAWPTPEAWAVRFLAALEEAAESEPDAVKRSKLRKVVESVREAGTGVIVGVAANVISGQIG